MDEREAHLARRIGEAVRHHRQLRGLSQEALAERVELSTHFVGLVCCRARRMRAAGSFPIRLFEGRG